MTSSRLLRAQGIFFIHFVEFPVSSCMHSPIHKVFLQVHINCPFSWDILTKILSFITSSFVECTHEQYSRISDLIICFLEQQRFSYIHVYIILTKLLLMDWGRIFLEHSSISRNNTLMLYTLLCFPFL